MSDQLRPNKAGGGSAVSETKLLGPILRSVSRSFYVSVRLLPRKLRQPVGLAYLLARATDTLADTAEIAAPLRREALAHLGSIIQETTEADRIGDWMKSFTSRQRDEAERTLIEALPECLAMLKWSDPLDREDIRQVLEKINRGQSLDLERFPDAREPRALATAAQLRDYTYLVAGCVGEFWTRLCFRHVQGFARLPEEQMLALGKEYGQGLQLINILRDVRSDLDAGRCYFPAEELAAIGLTSGQICREVNRFQPVYQRWLDETERGLHSGMKYVNAINDRRVRAATALPALLGARTLGLLRAAGAEAWQSRIKMRRGEVRGMIATVALTLAAREVLDRMFQRALGYKK
jgi:farnesyl-diphosphate farnesyltransferase